MDRDRWTAAEYRQYLETGREPAGRNERQQRIEEAYAKAEREGRVMVLDIPADAAPKKSKYGNEKETEDGITFDSKHEHNVYRWLKARKERGELRWVFVHIPFRFMSGVVYWADFMTIRADGTVEAVWDAKSKPTADKREYINKKKQLKVEWGIDIIEVMREHYDGNGGYFSQDWPIVP